MLLYSRNQHNICKAILKKRDELAKNGKRMEIVASGHVSDDLSDQIEELNKIAQLMPDAIVFISNRFDIGNTSFEKWVSDIKTVIRELPKDIKLGIYECPKPYKRILSEKMIEFIASTGRFSFIKDTCCDAKVIKKRLEILKGSGVELYNANAQTLLETLRYGAAGYSGVMANFHPQIYKRLLELSEGTKREIVQAYICLSAFTESLAYPATAKYYLKEYEGLNITSISRVVSCEEITDYQKSCLWQMKVLGDYILQQTGEERKWL